MKDLIKKTEKELKIPLCHVWRQDQEFERRQQFEKRDCPNNDPFE